jgi:putative phosphoesterase
MRILVVSDIHANWAALAAIDESFDFAICLGDLVDYGPDPQLCVQWAMKHARYSIRGNHDHGVAQSVTVQGESGYRYLTRETRKLMWDALGPDERRYLLQLPLTTRFEVDNHRYLLVHGTPRDPLDEYLMREPAIWAKRLEQSDADIVCVGHSHLQFNLRAGSTVVVNPGSVGNPRDGDPRAAYAIIEGNKIELKRVAYPVEETIARLDASALPEKAKEMLREIYRHGRLHRQQLTVGTGVEDES